MRYERQMSKAFSVIAAALFASVAMATPRNDFARLRNMTDPPLLLAGGRGNECHTWCEPTWGPCSGKSHKHDRSCKETPCTGKPLNPGSDHCKWY